MKYSTQPFCLTAHHSHIDIKRLFGSLTYVCAIHCVCAFRMPIINKRLNRERREVKKVNKAIKITSESYPENYYAMHDAFDRELTV